MKRAFQVTVTAWIPEVEFIQSATSRAKAKYAAWKAAHEAGYDSIKFGDLRVIRAPEFDCIALLLKHGVELTAAYSMKNLVNQEAKKAVDNAS